MDLGSNRIANRFKKVSQNLRFVGLHLSMPVQSLKRVMNSGVIFSELPLIPGDEQKALSQRRERGRVELRCALPCLD